MAEEFNNLLFMAVETGNVKLCEDILASGLASIDALDKNDNTPFKIALASKQVEIIAFFYQNGFLTKEDEGDALSIAVALRDNRFLEYLILLGLDVNQKNSIGETPLNYAFTKQNLEAMEILLDAGANYNIQDDSEFSVYHWAVLFGAEEQLKLLLEYGADPNIVTGTNTTPYKIAFNLDYINILRLLRTYGADISKLPEIQVAILDRKIEPEHLVKDKINEKCPYKGNTALHLATLDNDLYLLERLIERGGDVNIKNDDFKTPLCLAAQKGFTKMISGLVLAGADIECKDNLGFTPLHFSALCAQSKATRHLINLGADIWERDNFTTSVLHNLGLPQFYTMYDCRQQSLIDTERIKIGDILLQSGLPIDIRERFGRTPLHLAIENEDIVMVEFFIKRTADVNAVTKIGYTPLHLAVKEKNIDIINLLLQSGASLMKIKKIKRSMT